MVQSLSERVPSLPENLLQKIAYLDLDERKSLIKLCRSGTNYLPYPHQQLYQQTRAFMETEIFPDDNEKSQLINFFIQDSFLRWFLIDLVRAAPYKNTQKIHEEYVKAIDSEMKCHMKIQEESQFNYGAIFKDIYSKIHPLFPYQPVVHAMIRNKIRQWVHWCTRTGVLYPKMSSKEPSQHSFRSITDEGYVTQRLQCGNLAVYSIDQVADILQYPFSGENEMRQKWKFQDNKPRPYYAIGSTDFFRCGVGRRVCNKLADFFENTHRHTKLDTSHLVINPGDDLLIYDLSAFTSNLSELKFFLLELVDFIKDECGNPSIQCAIGGKIEEIKLSHLMYCICCSNMDVHFSIPSMMVPPGEIDYYSGSSSGLLGVYTNIVLSTVLHGIFASIISGGFARNRCAGDDGILVLPTQNIDDAIPMIQSFGDLAPEKVWDTKNRDDKYKVFLKRPLILQAETIFTSEQVPFPSCEPIIIPPQYTLHKTKNTPFSRLRRSQSQVYSFCNYLFSNPYKWSLASGLAKQVVRAFLEILYSDLRYYGFKESGTPLPVDGGILFGIRIYPISDLLRDDDMAVTVERFEYWLYLNHEHSFQVHEKRRINGIEGSHSVGESFNANSSGHLSYLEKLGYLHRSKILKTYLISNNFDYILSNNRKDNVLRVYKYTVLNPIPDDFIYEMSYSNPLEFPDVIEDTNNYEF